MGRRHIDAPEAWLVLGRRSRAQIGAVLDNLPRGSGILMLSEFGSAAERRCLLRRLRYRARGKDWVVAVEESGDAVRVHDLKELRNALLRRTPIVLLSPLYPTGSHPDWAPIRRMRAAALARLAKRRLVALGGMDGARFGRIQRLGFVSWAAIGAWIRT